MMSMDSTLEVETLKEHLCIFLSTSRRRKQRQIKMSEAKAKDAFIIFDEAYEGNDVDGFYVGDILRALGCNATNADTSSTGCKEDYVEGLKVFDKDGAGKVPLPEVLNVLSSLGEKLEPIEADKLVALLDLKAE